MCVTKTDGPGCVHQGLKKTEADLGQKENAPNLVTGSCSYLFYFCLVVIVSKAFFCGKVLFPFCFQCLACVKTLCLVRGVTGCPIGEKLKKTFQPVGKWPVVLFFCPCLSTGLECLLIRGIAPCARAKLAHAGCNRVTWGRKTKASGAWRQTQGVGLRQTLAWKKLKRIFRQRWGKRRGHRGCLHPGVCGYANTDEKSRHKACKEG